MSDLGDIRALVEAAAAIENYSSFGAPDFPDWDIYYNRLSKSRVKADLALKRVEKEMDSLESRREKTPDALVAFANQGEKEGYVLGLEQAAKDCEEEAEKIVKVHDVNDSATYLSPLQWRETDVGRVYGLREQAKRIRNLKLEDCDWGV